MIKGWRANMPAVGLAAFLALWFGSAGDGVRTVRAQPAAVARSGQASRSIDPDLLSRLRKSGDLTLRDMPLREALLMIGRQWDVNLVIGANLEGTVSGAFVASPLSEILDSILLSHGYSYRPVGRTLVVLPLAELGDLNPLFESAVIPVRHGEPADVLEGVRLLTSPQGKVEAIAAAHSLLVVDFPDRVAMIRQFIDEMNRTAASFVSGPTGLGPQPMEVLELRPQYVAAEALESAIENLLSEEGKVAVVDGENMLIATDYAGRLEVIRKTVAHLDVPRRQVRIVSLIYDIDIEDMENLGINWNSAVQGRQNADGEPQSIFNAATLMQAAPLAGTPDGAFTFFNLSRHFDLNTVVRALHQSQYSRLLADPSVTVLEHERAVMSIVEEIPFQQLTQTSGGGNIGTTAFREAGVKLEVTPKISNDGTVEMQVIPSFSRLTGFTPGENPQPIIDKRETETVVRVANGETLVIGGLRTRQDIRDRDGVPFLENIHFLHIGALFRGREFQTRESELVVFLRPEIVSVVCSSSPREAQAQNVGNFLLDSVPAATIDPCECIPLPPVGPEGEIRTEVEVIETPASGDALPNPGNGAGPSLAPPPDPTERSPANPSVVRRVSATVAAGPDRLPPVVSDHPPAPPGRQSGPTTIIAGRPETQRRR